MPASSVPALRSVRGGGAGSSSAAGSSRSARRRVRRAGPVSTGGGRGLSRAASYNALSEEGVPASGGVLAPDRGTTAWFAELAKEVEVEGDLAFARVRAPLFEQSHKPHIFSAEERKRMDCYESIDYNEPQSLVYKMRMASRDQERRWLKWFMYVAIGVAIGLWSVLLFQTLDFLAETKLDAVQEFITAQRNANAHDGAAAAAAKASVKVRTPEGVPLVAVAQGYGVYVLWSVLAALLSSLCCVVMPTAAGSGIPDVMAYLNGVMFPRIFNVRNLVIKTLSCLLAVSAGLPVGTEGPMIHIGSLIGAGLPTGRSRWLRCSASSLLDTFRNSKDERDFISAGAACGLTCAFSSPLGGMLFVMEEMATFFPPQLAWMVLVSCLACMCVTQLVNTFLSGWKLVQEAGALPMSSGNFRDAAVSMFYLDTVPGNTVAMNVLTFVPTTLVAVAAGFLAVGYTVSSIRCTRWRSRTLVPTAVLRVLEPCVFAFFFASTCYLLPLAFPCEETPAYVRENMAALNIRLFTAVCKDPDSTFHPLATLMMTSPYNLIRLLFSRRTVGLTPWHALLLHLLLYVPGSSYAGGMFISCGTVIPSLLIGAVLGRLVGVVFDRPVWADQGVLALMGAAAYFAGISRLSFSLLVIMMELTSDLTHIPCLMLGVVLAKCIADRCCHSFYHASLEVKATPFLEAQTTMHKLDTYSAVDILTSPVVALETIDTMTHLVEVLRATPHHAFPVVHPTSSAYAGMMRRDTLELLMWVMYLREVGEEGVLLFDEERNGEENAEEERNDGAEEGRYDDDGVSEWYTVRVGGAVETESPQQSLMDHSTWLITQPHATDEELRRVREFIFWHRLPAMPPVECLPVDSMQSFVDLTPYMDRAAYYVQETTCLSRAYYIFRHLGLRHLPVLNRHQHVVGILTRTNFVGDRLQDKISEAEERLQREAVQRHAGL